MSLNVPSREEILQHISEAQKRGWPTDPVGEAFFEASVVSLWLEEFERAWKTYLCLAAYELSKEVSKTLGELKSKEDLIREKGLEAELKAAEEAVKKALVFWSTGDEVNSHKLAKEAESHIKKIMDVLLKEDEKAIEELKSKAKALIAEIRQLEIPVVLELDDDLKPIEEKIKEAETLLEHKKIEDAKAKYEEIVKDLEKLKEDAEKKRKEILIGAGLAGGVATLGLLYAYKAGKLKAPELAIPKLPFGEKEGDE